MSRFNFTLKHVPETRIGMADSLSRRLDWKVGVENDNENQKLIKEEWIIGMMEVVVKGPEMMLLEKIKKTRGKDKEIVTVAKEMKKAGVKNLREDEWKIEEDLVLKEGKLYVPKNKELRMEIVWLHHDTLAAGHGGRWKMMELVTRNYWWPGITKDVGKYVEGYNTCQRMKNRTEAPAGKLMTNEVLEKSWTYLVVDFIIKLLLVAGKDTILVVYNRSSKITHFVATTEGTLAEGLVRLFRDNMWKLHRLPESEISDRGPQFAAELIKELNKMLRIETKLSTVFHCQARFTPG